MIPDIIDSKPTPIIIQIQNRKAHMPVTNESEYFENADKILLREFFPQAKVVTIKGANHWVHADRPEIFFLAVLNFLTGFNQPK